MSEGAVTGKLFDGCWKHDSAFQYETPPPPCIHCTEDERILGERLMAVAQAIAPDTPSSLGLHIINDRSFQRAAIYDALRDLVREVRR